ncbi:decarboxylase [Clostridium tetani]|uniref:aminotransferase class I/II-fold pyridoxal phosphate-dependent enzyme n=1 Tax=Clostridium tetani TaxID=1513 RepID=UPI000512CB27|nr:aminotransferase class V-fold PLP-dependent enzyme [Clostridium tetani]KGI44594.1 decarboxylase [Clostridium tetani]RXI53508.1 aminotransferase class V-fold PLP-dependent enzyme [Clostridium tetani]RXI56520.1 aminotransferase class V-fold PLP-dependent enzyme [Clostridium tetani]RXI74704.1 aminotransferase class V-fold PLP-dependent enzyme [Clostridium tetani]RXI77522.1 aminotransferase class V-fold PLP-dependent enzyme [Clostridium tetani]
MSKLPLVEGVLNYIKKKNIYFSMPGHKQGEGFLSTDIGKEIKEQILKLDITEVDGVDNLHNPTGIIKESQIKLSELYGSKKSYFLVNGSSSGNMIMIFSSFEEGDKIIIDRNCHKSIFNTIIIRKLKAIYVKNKIHKGFNLPLSVDSSHIIKTIKENKDAKGIIITYPNYYGICCDLEKIIIEAKKHNMKVLIDCAHGAHFVANEKLPKNPVKLGADMVVMSSHKTLPSLTQTAFLHVNNEELIDKVDFYFDTFISTSPSYLFLVSMDYSRYYLEEYGEETYEKLIKLLKIYKQKINSLKHLHIIDQVDIMSEYTLDKSRYILHIEEGYSANLLMDYLLKNNIQCEMNDTYNIVIIVSPFHVEKEIKYLYEVLLNCDFSKFKIKEMDILNHNIPKKKLEPFEVLNKGKKIVEVEESLDCVCAENIVPYPPGIPIIMMGEIMDEETIEVIKYYEDNGIEVIGLHENQINVVK